MEGMTDFAEALAVQMTSGFEQAQEMNLAALEVFRAFSALFQPEMGAAAGPYTLPDGVPSATSAIDQVYGFAAEVLGLQHDYLVRAAQTMTPPSSAKNS